MATTDQEISLDEINHLIQRLKEAAETLAERANIFPALEKNMARILASIKMLEINVSDIPNDQ